VLNKEKRETLATLLLRLRVGKKGQIVDKPSLAAIAHSNGVCIHYIDNSIALIRSIIYCLGKTRLTTLRVSCLIVACKELDVLCIILPYSIVALVRSIFIA